MHALIAQLAVAQAVHGVVFVKPLLRACGRFDVPFDHAQTQGIADLPRQFGFAGARFAFYKKRPLQGNRCIDGNFQVIGGDVVFGALKFHLVFNLV